MASCLRSFSRRNLYSKWLCFKNSRPVLYHTKEDYSGSSFQDSSLLIRSFHHRKVFFKERNTQMSLGTCSVLLSRHMSSSRPEDLSQQIDVLSNVAEEEPTVTTAIENFSFPEYVINGIHELTGLNWRMSIVLTSVLVSVLMSPVSTRVIVQVRELTILAKSLKQVMRMKKTCDPKSLSKYKNWEAELINALEKQVWSCFNFYSLDAYVYITFIKAISAMAKKVPGFENGGIFWFTDLSTQDSFYILPLVTIFTFWWTREMFISKTDITSRMKRLSWITFVFFALQAAFEYESAVYIYMISSRIYSSTLILMLMSQKMVKSSSVLGWPNDRVTTVYENQTSRLISLLKKYIDVVKKKHKM